MSDRDREIAQSHIDLESRIRARAHEMWKARGQDSGEKPSLEDWLRAEQEVLGKDPHQPAQDRGTVVGDAHVPQNVGELGEA